MRGTAFACVIARYAYQVCRDCIYSLIAGGATICSMIAFSQTAAFTYLQFAAGMIDVQTSGSGFGRSEAEVEAPSSTSLRRARAYLYAHAL